MAGFLAVWAVTMLAVGATAMVLVRYGRANRRRIGELERQIEAMSEAERIVARAQHYRRDRSHLKLLVLVPALWLADRLRSPQARLLAATAASGMVTGASFLAVDGGGGHRAPIDTSPPAAADTTIPVVDGLDTYTYDPPDTTTISAAALPPAPAADPPGSTPPTTDAPVEASAPGPTTTTTTVLPDLSPATEPPVTVPRQCLNENVAQLKPELCLGG